MSVAVDHSGNHSITTHKTPQRLDKLQSRLGLERAAANVPWWDRLKQRVEMKAWAASKNTSS